MSSRPCNNNLRIFRGEEIAAPKQPQHLSPNEIANQFLASIDFGDKETRAIAPAGTTVHQVVDALNSRWRAITSCSFDLLGEDTLNSLLPLSPEHLQRKRGPDLVFQAAVSVGSTEDKNLNLQRRSLATEGLDVASPAATAIVLAGLLIKALEGGKTRTMEHFTEHSFRTQAVDPETGRRLDHHNVVITYDFKRGLVRQDEDPRAHSPNLWCAGTSEKPTVAETHRPNLLGWIFGS